MAGTQETTKIGQWKNEAIAVPEATTATLATIICPHGATKVTITIENADATNRFDVFSVSIRPTSTSPWTVQAATTAAFTTAIKLPLIYCSGDPTVLVKETNEVFQYDISGIDALLIQASNDTLLGSANLYYHFGA